MWRQPWQLGIGSHGKVGVAVPVTVLVSIKDQGKRYLRSVLCFLRLSCLRLYYLPK